VAADERPAPDLLLLVACVVGLLVGLGVFGIVSYLLIH
jgi:hypothetical protein